MPILTRPGVDPDRLAGDIVRHWRAVPEDGVAASVTVGAPRVGIYIDRAAFIWMVGPPATVAHERTRGRQGRRTRMLIGGQTSTAVPACSTDLRPTAFADPSSPALEPQRRTPHTRKTSRGVHDWIVGRAQALTHAECSTLRALTGLAERQIHMQ